MTLRNFILKLLLFILIVLGFQVIVARPVEYPRELIILDKVLQNGFSIIYFGDSTITSTSKNDPTTQTTPEILWRMLPKSKLWAITHPSLSLDVYDAYAQYILRKGYHPKFLIFPINLRSFSPVWVSNPNMQFKSEGFIIRYKDTIWLKFYHPLGVFKYFEPPVSKYVFDNTKISYKGKTYGYIKELNDQVKRAMNDETRLKKQFILDYLYTLTPHYGKIQSMLRLVDRLKNTGIDPIFYITPVDFQSGSSLIGDDFTQTISANTRLIKSLLAERSIDVLDFSASLPAEAFMWREEGYPNEHLNLLGRYFLAKSLVEGTNLNNYR